ncbi:Alpha/beta hydrolase fold [Parasponia andersonii]|uniref:Alpha/beta hydrolase fold n=1 Tax=Parasponia andersonii TaxID=3476 RepID=A0A2P5DCY5_PARAD|nr:Alpha/beta hydrolase fold [Parasponia andersonii]
MKFRRMAAVSLDPRFNVSYKNHQQNGVIVEEIEGLIRVSKDGHVERPAIIPIVPSTWSLDQNLVTSKDIIMDNLTNLWARTYVPTSSPGQQKPLLVYFHGGGFCVGSAAWSCYHEFLANLSTKTNCVIISVNYRLAPENRLPAAFEDGFNALMWIKQQAQSSSTENKFWLNQCNMSSPFLAGDSAGANIVYHVATRLATLDDAVLRPIRLKGTILIQPFFGGESRTGSERYASQPPNSALTLSASDTYWRLSLPLGADRDHPWCNPLANINNGSTKLRSSAVMVCVSETDILRDRNLEFCNALVSSGKKVEMVMCKGVGHAFQILHNSNYSQARTQEMMSHIKSFINQ